LIPPEKRTNWRLEAVRPNDTFASIAQRVGVSEMALIAINGGKLRVGQKVLIPQNTSRKQQN
jgi:LysM repeat protein